MSISRRNLLTAAGTLAATGTLAQPAAPRPALQLRILETSDLHMFVLDWDYYRAQPDPTVGLAKVASLIAQARGEVTNSLLFDNGDLLQGNPLGDYLTTVLAPQGCDFDLPAAQEELQEQGIQLVTVPQPGPKASFTQT